MAVGEAEGKTMSDLPPWGGVPASAFGGSDLVVNARSSEPCSIILQVGTLPRFEERTGWFEFRGGDRWLRFRFAGSGVEFEQSEGLVLDDAAKLILDGVRLVAEEHGFVVLWPKYR
jgi:hypothetical protein